MNEQIMKHFNEGISKDDPHINYLVNGFMYHIHFDKISSFWKNYLTSDHNINIKEVPNTYSPVIIDCISPLEISIDAIVKIVDISIKEIGELLDSNQKIDYKCYVFKNINDKTKRRLYFANFSMKTKIIRTALIEKLRKIISSGTNCTRIESILIPESIDFFDKKGGYLLQGIVNNTKFKKIESETFSHANKYKSDMNYNAYEIHRETYDDVDLHAIIFSIKNRKDRIIAKSSIKNYFQNQQNVIEISDYVNLKKSISYMTRDISSLSSEIRRDYSKDINFVNKSITIMEGFRNLTRMCDKAIEKSIVNIKNNPLIVSYMDSYRDINIFSYSPVLNFNCKIDEEFMEKQICKVVYGTILDEKFSNKSLKDNRNSTTIAKTINKTFLKKMKDQNILMIIDADDVTNGYVQISDQFEGIHEEQEEEKNEEEEDEKNEEEDDEKNEEEDDEKNEEEDDEKNEEEEDEKNEEKEDEKNEEEEDDEEKNEKRDEENNEETPITEEQSDDYENIEEGLQKTNKSEKSKVQQKTNTISKHLIEKNNLKNWIENHIVSEPNTNTQKIKIYKHYELDCECFQKKSTRLSYTTFLKDFPDVIKESKKFPFFKSKKIKADSEVNQKLHQSNGISEKNIYLRCYSGIAYISH